MMDTVETTIAIRRSPDRQKRCRRRRPLWLASNGSTIKLTCSSLHFRWLVATYLLGSTWLCSLLFCSTYSSSLNRYGMLSLQKCSFFQRSTFFATAFSPSRTSLRRRGWAYNSQTQRPQIQLPGSPVQLVFLQRHSSKRASISTTTSLRDATIEDGISSLDLRTRSLSQTMMSNSTSLNGNNPFMNHFSPDGTSSSSSSDTPSFASFSFLRNHSQQLLDVPMPTVNGGFTHTTASKAKISKANKGREPWNKGRSHAEDVRARIAAGVRAKNRERFLEKLQAMNMTEAEYERQQKEEQDKIEAERRSRRTESGGYRPTDETRQKISQVLKTKYANGTVQPRKVDPTKVRRGFTHTPETRAKISASLRERWAADPQYRANMEEKTKRLNSQIDVRQKISETLRQKWQDPDFRQEMLLKMANRTSSGSGSGSTRGSEHRAKISASMKQRWQDEEYRNKALANIMARRVARPPKPERSPSSQTRTSRSKSVKKSRSYDDSDDQMAVRMVQPLEHPRLRAEKKMMKKKLAKALAEQEEDESDDGVVVVPVVAKSKPKSKTTTRAATTTMTTLPKTGLTDPFLERLDGDDESGNDAERAVDEAPADNKKQPKDGSVTRLREERRDLYDLLYGDEDEDHPGRPKIDLDDTYDTMVEVPSILRHSPQLLMLGDEDLDEFDPYGLQNF